MQVIYIFKNMKLMYYKLEKAMEEKMRVLKKMLIIMMIAVMIVSVLVVFSGKTTASTAPTIEGETIKVGVLLYRFDDAFIALVRHSLEEIQRNNEGKVEFTFYDGKNNQSVQNQTINTLLQSGDVDLLLLNLVDTGSSAQTIVNKIKEKNIPLILFNREPLDMNVVKSYNKAYFVGTTAEEAGILQGKILVNAWKKNKKSIDQNGDNIIQYVMLMGERGNIEADARTKYSILTINNAGIKTQEIALRVCDWNEDVAQNMTETLFLQHGNKIEAIIANNDAMAIGAIQALQKYGYNRGGSTKTISVVGVDAIPIAQELIKNGIMTGSVLQDADTMAQALYKIGMNLVHNRNPLEGTEYKFDETGVAVRIPYKEYIENIK